MILGAWGRVPEPSCHPQPQDSTARAGVPDTSPQGPEVFHS